MTIIKSYAAKEAGGELELYEYDAYDQVIYLIPMGF